MEVAIDVMAHPAAEGALILKILLKLLDASLQLSDLLLEGGNHRLVLLCLLLQLANLSFLARRGERGREHFLYQLRTILCAV